MIGLDAGDDVAVLAQGLRRRSRAQSRASSMPTTRSRRRALPAGSTAAGEAIRKSGLASAVAGVRGGEGRAFGKNVQVTGVEPGISQMIRLKWKVGSNASLDNLGAHGAVVDKDYAKSHHLVVGSPIQLVTPSGELRRPEGEGDLRPASGRVSVRAHHLLVAGLRQRLHEPAEPLLVRRHFRWRDRGEHERAREAPCGLPGREDPDRAAVHRQRDQRPRTNS